VKSTGRHRKVLRGKKGADENAKSQVTRASAKDSRSGPCASTEVGWGETNLDSQLRNAKSLPESSPVSLLDGREVSSELSAFARFANVDEDAFPLTKFNVDLCFISGTVSMSLETGELEHLCSACWDELDAAGKDAASTVGVEILSQRASFQTAEEGGNPGLFPVSTCAATLRKFKTAVRKAIGDVLGVHTVPKSIGVYKGKSARGMNELATKAAAEAESQMLTTEILHVAVCTAIVRMDNHHVLGGERSSLRIFRKVGKGEEIAGAIPDPHSQFSYSTESAPTRVNELHMRAGEIGARAAAAVWRVCVCLLGLSGVQCVLLGGKCKAELPGTSEVDVANWFRRNAWHRHPRAGSFSKWGKLSGGGSSACVRLCNDEQRNVGLCLLDRDACKIVARSLEGLKEVLEETLSTSKYDFDLWASDPSNGMRIEKGRLGGDRFDHAILRAIYEGSCKVSNTAWRDSRMTARIDRVLVAVSKQRGGTSVSDSLWRPVICHLSASERSAGRYIPYFLEPTGSGTVLSRPVVQELPVHTRLEITNDVVKKVSASGKGKRKSSATARSSKWRKNKKCNVRAGALGILSDAITTNNGKSNRAVLSATLEDVATGLAVRMLSDGLRDISSLEDVQKVVRKTLASDIEIVDLSLETEDIVEDAAKVRNAMVADLFASSSEEELAQYGTPERTAGGRGQKSGSRKTKRKDRGKNSPSSGRKTNNKKVAADQTETSSDTQSEGSEN